MKKSQTVRGEVSAKPRNPYALAARQKAAGSHDRHQTVRSLRRSEKQMLNARLRQRDLADE
ncbi:hypothetical protein [Undibacterium squillarum]|uniref:Uncharacterized protein n=1 Tax=Undibacterium squillarum TaxID=1131567 RepID=A0ABQ2XXY0_9BURK|nr:hypothetical protein [Undibacterium squillarum]GGX41451.1 hypothetical protein GCM10010946_19950 [Undibacterium squillarum]